MIQEKTVNQSVIGEQLVGVIPDVVKTRMLVGKDQFDVVVTTKRMIFIPIQSVPGGYRALEKFVSLPTQTVLTENKKSIVIEKDDIKSVSYKEGTSYVDCCRKVMELDGELEIYMSKGKYSLSVPFRRNTITKNVLEKAGLPSLTITRPNVESEEPHQQSGGSCCSR